MDKIKLFSVYMNNRISHCYYSDSILNIDMSTKIHYCDGNGIADEIKDVAEKAKIIVSIKDFFNRSNVK